MVAVRFALHTGMRAAGVSLLEGWAAAGGISLQVYPGRPRTIYPPTGYIDGIGDNVAYEGLRRRTARMEVMLIHGIYDSEEAATQKDRFVDGFIDYVTDNPYAAGAATNIEYRSSEDIPDFIPEWLPLDRQITYYATRIELEGLSLDAN